MAILNIVEAKREGARLVVGLAGQSGSGKTLSAIYLAYGLANYNAKKIGFIDTENRRGSLYADALKKHPTHPTNEPFWIGDLYAPFTPERYKQAIEEFQAAGVEVLVIDSVSHEYEGEGGYLEIREPLPGKFGKRDNVAATEHKKFMRALLQSSCDVVPCIRAREKVKIEKGIDPETGKFGTIYVPQGLQPIQHRDFMFELTASVMMHDSGTRQTVIKCPDELMPILGRGVGYLTSDDGKALRDWRDGGAQVNPDVEKARADLLMAAEHGMAGLQEAWGKLAPSMRKTIGGKTGCPTDLKAVAEAFDLKAKGIAEAGGAPDQATNALNAAAANVAAQNIPASTEVRPDGAQAGEQIDGQGLQQAAEEDGEFF